MHYRCDNCGKAEWRGFFPERTFHPRYVIFHGVTLGVSSCIVRAILERMSCHAEGFRGGMIKLGGCLVVMVGIYGFAVMLETCIVAAHGCTNCRSHKMVIFR